MDRTPDWMRVDSYSMARKKDELITMALSLHHAWVKAKADLREAELALIESRTTVKAMQPAYRSAADEYAAAARRYCAKHGVKSVSEADLERFILEENS